MQLYFDYLRRNLRYRIGSHKKVIDLGSGHSPLIRADILFDRFPLETVQRPVNAIFMPSGRFVVGDIMELPFKNKSFDFAYSSAVLEHLPDPLEACSEISRVACEGILRLPSALWETMGGSEGHLWLINDAKDRLIFKRKTKKDMELSSRIPRHISDSRKYSELFNSFYSDFYIDHSWKDSIKAEIVSTDDGSEPYVLEDNGAKPVITEESIGKRIKRGDTLPRKVRLMLFALLRKLLGGNRLDLLSVLACPVCKNELTTDGSPVLICGTCRKKYPFYQGVPILLRDQAMPI